MIKIKNALIILNNNYNINYDNITDIHLLEVFKKRKEHFNKVYVPLK